MLASLVERRSGIATASQKGKPWCVGFCFTLRDVLVIHDSESLSKPTTSCGSILSMVVANCRIAPARREGYSGWWIWTSENSTSTHSGE